MSDINVRHEPRRQRFIAMINGHEAVCEYRLAGNVMLLTHTEVAPALGGRGIAGQMVQAALDHARAQGLRVRPVCSYVQTFMRRHREAHDLLESAQP